MGLSLGVKRVRQRIRVMIVKIMSRNFLELGVLEVPSLIVQISLNCLQVFFAAFATKHFNPSLSFLSSAKGSEGMAENTKDLKLPGKTYHVTLNYLDIHSFMKKNDRFFSML